MVHYGLAAYIYIYMIISSINKIAEVVDSKPTICIFQHCNEEAGPIQHLTNLTLTSKLASSWLWL